MLSSFGSISPYFHLKKKIISIDNIVFQFHYRWSFAILLTATLLVTSRQYIGEHIRCITGTAVPERVLNTFCFFTTTFTMIRHLNESTLNSGIIPHPGVGPPEYEEDPIKRHAYYQWVPFVLFGQALLFYMPHYFWKKAEGGTIKSLAEGLQMVSISKHLSKNMKIAKKDFPSRDAMYCRVQNIKLTFLNRLRINQNWTTWLILCEILNLFNILLQIYTTNLFLGGQFYQLGIQFMEEDWLGKMNFLDVVFPKVTKCHFHKFGPSGTIQLHDALCVMALNVINEKIYSFLWFWFNFLLAISILAIVWRLITFILYKRSTILNAFVFSHVNPGRMCRKDIDIIRNKCTYSDWMFLYYLGSNLDGYIFRDVLTKLSKEFDDEDKQDEIIDNENNHQSEAAIINQDPTKIMSIDTVDFAS